MDRNQHLWNELDAAGEKFVRRHLAMGGYEGWRKPTAERWLQLKDADHARMSAAWAKVGAVAAIASAIVAAALR
jgi:hypothetical protein